MTAINAQGTTFSINDNVLATAGSAVVVGEIISYSLADGTASDIDITTLASTAKEFRQGLQDFGDVTLEILRDFDDAGQAECLTAKAAQETRQCIITLASGTLDVGTFNAYVKSIDLNGAVDAVNTGTITLKITGAIAWT